MTYPARRCSFPCKLIFHSLAVTAALATCLVAAERGWASGGPESVLLVVNPRSPDSMCIANHYAALRRIPQNNFLFLEWDPKAETADVNTFRDKILLPVLRAAKMPIFGRQIDYVVYSSDFPSAIRIDDDITKFKALLEKQKPAKEEKPPAKSTSWMTYVTPMASINGLTYLWEPVFAGTFYVHPNCNWYARTGAAEQAKEPTLSFSSATAYGAHGEAASGPGRHYLLSTMLAVTAGRGNTREEAIACLTRMRRPTARTPAARSISWKTATSAPASARPAFPTRSRG